MEFESTPAGTHTDETCQRCGRKFGLFVVDERLQCNCEHKSIGGAEAGSGSTHVEEPKLVRTDCCDTCGKQFALFSLNSDQACKCGTSRPTMQAPAPSVSLKATSASKSMGAHKVTLAPKDDEDRLSVEECEIETALSAGLVDEEKNWEIPLYDVIEQLPSGTFCHVLKVKRAQFEGKIFVIKILKQEFCRNPRMIKRFEVETRKAAEIDHPHVAPIYDFGKTKNGVPYFVTDFFEAPKLSTLVREQGFIPESEAIGIFMQIADALIEAHASEVLHRSLKPRNIFVTRTPDGHANVKVTDFGTAKVLPTPGKDKLYATPEKIFGDARYMSPEQCRGERLDSRSDIYSFGCLMYDVLGGRTPFTGTTPIEIALKQLNKTPTPLSTRFPELELPIALESIVMKCLTKERAFRYQTVAEIKRDLAGIQKSLQVQDEKKQSHEHLVVHPEPPDARTRVILLIMLIATVLATYMLHNSSWHMAAPPPVVSQVGPGYSSKVEAAQTSFETATRAIAPYSITGTGGKILFSSYGTSFGQVLEQAARYDVDLSNADLSGQNLIGLNLQNAKLRNARFDKAEMSQVDFTRADLRGSQFSECNLNQSVFDRANLQGSFFTDSDLTKTSMSESNLQNSRFRDCTMTDTNLQSADFNGASVYQVDLGDQARAQAKNLIIDQRYPATVGRFTIKAKDGNTIYSSQKDATFRETIEEAVKTGISLADADLHATDLYSVDLSNADLRDADLRGALLTRANLKNADMTGADTQGMVREQTEEENTVH